MGQRTVHLTLDSPGATRAVGMAMGPVLPHRAVLLFRGEMAAGKTTLIKAICEGLGIAPEGVISPTYTLVNVYPGARPVYHVDLFRIEAPEALLDLDYNDWVNPRGPTLIEWPELAEPLLEGEAVLAVDLEAPAEGPERREMTVTGDPAVYEAVFAELIRLGAEPTA